MRSLRPSHRGGDTIGLCSQPIAIFGMLPLPSPPRLPFDPTIVRLGDSDEEDKNTAVIDDVEKDVVTGTQEPSNSGSDGDKIVPARLN